MVALTEYTRIADFHRFEKIRYKKGGFTFSRLGEKSAVFRSYLKVSVKNQTHHL